MRIKRNTSFTDIIGPFIDETDGRTELSTISMTKSDWIASKNGNTVYTPDLGTITHAGKGFYYIPIANTDVDTRGRYQLMCHKSPALPVWKDYMVMDENVYEREYGTTILPEINTLTTMLQTVDDNIDHIMPEINTLTTNLQTVDDNIDIILLDLNTIDTNVDTLLLNLQTVDDNVNTILVDLNTIDSNLDDVLIDLSTIDGKCDTIITDLNTIDSNIDHIMPELNTITNNIDHIMLELNTITTYTEEMELKDSSSNRMIIAKSLKTEDLALVAQVNDSIYDAIDRIILKLPVSGLIADKETQDEHYELDKTMSKNRFRRNYPNVGNVTFYKSDGSISHQVNVDSNGREPI